MTEPKRQNSAKLAELSDTAQRKLGALLSKIPEDYSALREEVQRVGIELYRMGHGAGSFDGIEMSMRTMSEINRDYNPGENQI